MKMVTGDDQSFGIQMGQRVLGSDIMGVTDDQEVRIGHSEIEMVTGDDQVLVFKWRKGCRSDKLIDNLITFFVS